MSKELSKIKTPFFIVGSPRSGTTLLVQILNRHSNIYIPPETEFFHYIEMYKKDCVCDYEDINMEDFVEYYRSKRAATFLGLPEVSGGDPLLRGANSLADIFTNIMEYLSSDVRKTRIGEKTPHHVRCMSYIKNNFPDAKFLIMVRDGRAVIKSRLKHPNWNDNYFSSSRVWNKDMDYAFDYINSNDDGSYLCVKYEDLLLEPEINVRKVLSFLSQEYEEGVLDGESKDKDKDYKGYYEQEWMRKSTGSIDKSRVQDWKNEYGDEELHLVEKLVGKNLERFSYSTTKKKSKKWLLVYVLHKMKDFAFYFRRFRNRFEIMLSKVFG